MPSKVKTVSMDGIIKLHLQEKIPIGGELMMLSLIT